MQRYLGRPRNKSNLQLQPLNSLKNSKKKKNIETCPLITKIIELVLPSSPPPLPNKSATDSLFLVDAKTIHDVNIPFLYRIIIPSKRITERATCRQQSSNGIERSTPLRER